MQFVRIPTMISLFISLSVGEATAKQFAVTSPNGLLRAQIECEDGQLYYSLYLEDRTVIRRSSISALENSVYEVISFQRETVDKTWEPVWGQFSSIRDRCNQLTLTLSSPDIDLELICRIYNDGFACRFSFPSQADLEGKTVQFMTEFLFDDDYRMYHPRGDLEPKGPIPISQFDPDDRGNSVPALVKLGKDLPSALIPVVIELGQDLYLAILESDLYTAASKADTGTMCLSPGREQPGLVSNNSARILGDHYVTPWRVILTGRQPGEMIISTLPVNLAAECELDDTSWIKTGKSMWDWRVRGYKTDDFTYGLDTDSFKRFIDFASKNNIRFLLIDWFWYRIQNGEFVVAPDIDIREVTSYAQGRGVELMLYWDEWRGGTLPMDKVFELYSDFGAAGVKYGFRGNNARFTAEAIAKAAQHELTIDFHDLVCPMVGVRRTYPNALTREYAHAQMDSGMISSPTTFLKMAMINMITGPLDMNHGFYALNTNPKTTTREGWSRTVESTVVSENARVLVCFSGLTVLPDAPEEYRKKADLFEFIARMPQATWDESLVIDSKLPDYISVARRKGDEWFVGTVVNEKGGELDIELDFLRKGMRYDVTFYEDAEDSHYITNKESYVIRKSRLSSGNSVRVKMAPGGGHAMWIRPEVRR